VYGASAKMGEKKVITKDTVPAPVGAYGDSKLQAELGIQPLNDDSFKVCILRPPMIYGPSCKGNYPLLSKAARKLPFFPDVKNQRSMLFVMNLCAFIQQLIDKTASGIYFPQNTEYVSTSEMVRAIAKIHGKNIHMTKIFNPFLRLFSSVLPVINKVFGNLVYEQMSDLGIQFCLPYSLDESIEATEWGAA
jgi:UDP-glucose 4-epimerase